MLEFTRIPGALERVSSHTWIMPENVPDDEAFPANDAAIRRTIEEVLGSLAAAERTLGSVRSKLRKLEQDLS